MAYLSDLKDDLYFGEAQPEAATSNQQYKPMLHPKDRFCVSSIAEG
jgi:hypothetical protein